MFSSDDSTVIDTEEQKIQKTLTGLFEVECDAALMMGLSYNDYWYGEPEMFYVYAKAYKSALERSAQEKDIQAWLIGQYVLEAVAVNFNAAFGKKGASKISYPEIPHHLAEHNEQAKIKKQERELMRSYNNFIAAAQAMGKL